MKAKCVLWSNMRECTDKDDNNNNANLQRIVVTLHSEEPTVLVNLINNERSSQNCALRFALIASKVKISLNHKHFQRKSNPLIENYRPPYVCMFKKNEENSLEHTYTNPFSVAKAPKVIKCKVTFDSWMSVADLCWWSAIINMNTHK